MLPVARLNRVICLNKQLRLFVHLLRKAKDIIIFLRNHSTVGSLTSYNVIRSGNQCTVSSLTSYILSGNESTASDLTSWSGKHATVSSLTSWSGNRSTFSSLTSCTLSGNHSTVSSLTSCTLSGNRGTVSSLTSSYYNSSSVCQSVCLSVCLFVPDLLRGPLTDLRQTWWVYVGGPRNCP